MAAATPDLCFWKLCTLDYMPRSYISLTRAEARKIRERQDVIIGLLRRANCTKTRAVLRSDAAEQMEHES